MIARILALSGLPFFTVLVIEAAAQTHPDPDALVADFIENGNVGMSIFFEGCPDLAAWQERGFRLLSSTELPPEREAVLAALWHYPLSQCGHAGLERWYIGQFRRQFSRGMQPSVSHWRAIQDTDSPRIREFLLATMEDRSLDQKSRNWAGFSYFHRLSGVERRDAYLEFFARLSLPEQVAWGVTTTLLRENADQLLERVGEIVRQRPELADQPAFATIVQSTSGPPSEQALRAFAESVREAAARAPAGGLRDRLRSAAAHVERRSQGQAEEGPAESRRWASAGLGLLNHEANARSSATLAISIQTGYRAARGFSIYAASTTLGMRRESTCFSGPCLLPRWYHGASMGGKYVVNVPSVSNLYLSGQYGFLFGEGRSWAMTAGAQVELWSMGHLGLEAIWGADTIAGAADSQRGILLRFSQGSFSAP